MTTELHATPTLTTLPARRVLAADGRGDSEASLFRTTIATLYAVRAGLWSVQDVPLEGTYTQDGDPERFDLDNPEGWHWTLAVPAPNGATPEAVAELVRRRDDGVVVELREQPRRRVVEVEHVGRYQDEGPTLGALYAFVDASGLVPAGPHTEVYLTDPRETAPGENRTVLQVPVGERGWTTD